MNRRHWIKQTALGGGFTLAGGWTLLGQNAAPAKLPALATSGLIKLSSNENPFGPSEAVREAISRSFAEACRYPYPYADALREKIAQKEGVSPDHIVITGGSTEGLKITGATFASNGGEIIAADPTFNAMMLYAREWGGTVRNVPVTQDLGYDVNAILEQVSDKTKLIFLCNPNNPTGTLLPADTLRSFCLKASEKTIVFSDEAYYDYIEEPNYPSMAELVREGRNVIVSRTFSKVYGLAGLRIGYLLAKPELISQIDQKLVAYSNVLAIAAASAAMEDPDFYQFSLEQNRISKNMIYDTLKSLDLRYIPSHTNFVFFHSGIPIRELHRSMMEKGIQVGRPFPPFMDWCRISTGTPEQTEAFTRALRQLYT